MTDLPLILLPGLGTDERLYALQKMVFPDLIVPPWLPPGYHETLPEYAARLAAAVNPGRPCFVGGTSFGGMLALEMTRHLSAKGCLLISCVRSADELPLWARVLGPYAWLLPPGSDRALSWFGTLMRFTIGPFLPKNPRQFFIQLSKTRSPQLSWACRVAPQWRPTGDWPCPVFHLHGTRDHLLRATLTTPTQLVVRGGHLLPLTHPFVVNAFLQESMDAALRSAM